MKKQTTTKETSSKKTDNAASLKNDAQKDNGVKKGYNEKNPTQPQGAFKPDAMKKK